MKSVYSIAVVLTAILGISVLFGCGKKDKGQTQPATKYPITIIEHGETKVVAPSPELEVALDIMSKIDPQTDTLQEIIEQYKQAKKALAQKIEDKSATREEKYVYVIVDSFLLLHQLFYFINALAGVAISGEFNQKTIANLLDALPSASSVRLEPYQTESAIPYGCSEIAGIAMTLCSSVEGVYLGRIERSIKLLREIQQESEEKDSDFKIEIKTLPVKVQLAIIRAEFDFGGVHDLGMVYFIESILDIIDAFHRLIFSVNIDAVLQRGFQISKYMQAVSFTEDPLLHAGRILTFLLKKDGTFLTLASTIEVKRTRYQLLQAIEKTIRFLNYAKEKNLNSPKSVISFDGQNYIIRYKLEGEVKEAKFLKENTAEEFKKIVDKLRRNLERDPQVPHLPARDLIYISSVVFVAGIKTGIFDPIINAVLPFIAPDQAKIIRQFLNSNLFTPEAISGVISAILGDMLYFDFGTAFGKLERGEISYRRWLPIWTTAFSSEMGDIVREFGDNFVVEWDCGAKLYDSSITNYKEGRKEFFGSSCTQPQNDSSHFGLSATQISSELKWSSSWEIPADGIFFKTPYILFLDPTFGGLLKLKISSIIEKSGNDKAKAKDFLAQCGINDPESATQPELYTERKGLCALNLSLNLILGSVLGAISGS